MAKMIPPGGDESVHRTQYQQREDRRRHHQFGAFPHRGHCSPPAGHDLPFHRGLSSQADQVLIEELGLPGKERIVCKGEEQ